MSETLVRAVESDEDIEHFAHDHCVHLPDNFHHKREATAFDIAMHEIFVDHSFQMDQFAVVVGKMCHLTRVRTEADIQVSEACKNPTMMGVIEKTAHAMKTFRPIRQDWAAWAKQMHIDDLDDLDHEQDISPIERISEEQRSALDAYVELGEQGLTTKSSSGVQGWKRLLVGLLMQSTDSMDLWVQHKDALMHEIHSHDIEVFFREGEAPQIHAAHDFLTHHFTPEEVEALEAVEKVEDEDEAGHPIQATEDLADTTLAASHLGDALSHIKLAHEIVVDSEGFSEMRNLFSSAETLMQGKFEPMKVLGVTSTLTDELVGHHVGPLASLTLAQDILHLAQNSEELKGDLHVMQEYMRAQILEGVGNDLMPRLRDMSEFSHAAKNVGDVQVKGARAMASLIKGGDAMVRLASNWQKLPGELCNTFAQHSHHASHFAHAGVF